MPQNEALRSFKLLFKHQKTLLTFSWWNRKSISFLLSSQHYKTYILWRWLRKINYSRDSKKEVLRFPWLFEWTQIDKNNHSYNHDRFATQLSWFCAKKKTSDNRKYTAAIDLAGCGMVNLEYNHCHVTRPTTIATWHVHRQIHRKLTTYR